MATNYSVGHGMRRRSGTLSSYTESAGKSMARYHQTSDEAHSDADAAGSVRIPMGLQEAVPALQGTLVPKKNVQAADPTGAGTKANRQNIERIGATYRVQPKSTYIQIDPAAGPTMANARIIPSVAGRANPNFEAGIESSSY